MITFAFQLSEPAVSQVAVFRPRPHGYFPSTLSRRGLSTVPLLVDFHCNFLAYFVELSATRKGHIKVLLLFFFLNREHLVAPLYVSFQLRSHDGFPIYSHDYCIRNDRKEIDANLATRTAHSKRIIAFPINKRQFGTSPAVGRAYTGLLRRTMINRTNYC